MWDIKSESFDFQSLRKSCWRKWKSNVGKYWGEGRVWKRSRKIALPLKKSANEDYGDDENDESLFVHNFDNTVVATDVEV